MLIAASILSIIVILSYLWLMIEGFKKHVMWGIGIFFIPLVAIVFAVMNWQKAKIPFLTYLIASILLVAAIFEPMTEVINEAVKLEQRVETGELTKQQSQKILQQKIMKIFSIQQGNAVDDDNLLTPEEQRIESLRAELQLKNEAALASQAYAEEQAAKEEKVEEVLRKVKVFTPIKISESNQYIGKKIRIVSFEGVERQGILINAGFDRLTLDRKLAGGGFKFDVLIKDIKTLEVQKFELR